jgi:hypothetical protein
MLMQMLTGQTGNPSISILKSGWLAIGGNEHLLQNKRVPVIRVSNLSYKMLQKQL